MLENLFNKAIQCFLILCLVCLALLLMQLLFRMIVSFSDFMVETVTNPVLWIALLVGTLAVYFHMDQLTRDNIALNGVISSLKSENRFLEREVDYYKKKCPSGPAF